MKSGIERGPKRNVHERDTQSCCQLFFRSCIGCAIITALIVIQYLFRHMKSSRVPLSGLAHCGAVLANGGRDLRSGETLFSPETAKILLTNLDLKNIKNEIDRNFFHEIGFSFFMEKKSKIGILIVPKKFSLVVLKENEEIDLKNIFSVFCEKFRINRFEQNFTIRSSLKSVEEKVNLSKYHLFLSVVENKMDEVRLYGQENSPFLLQKDHNGRSLLHIAASYGHVSNIRYVKYQ